MNRSLQIVGLATLLALPCAVQGQETRSVSFGASGGVSIPMGDLADGADMGYSVAGHIYFMPSTMQSLKFRGDVSYDSWGIKDGGTAGVDASLSSMGFTGNAIFHLGEASASMRPYLLGGGGMYRAKASVSSSGVGVSATSTDFGIQGGVGAEFKLSGFSTFLEAKFVNVFSEGSSTNYLPITFGVRF